MSLSNKISDLEKWLHLNSFWNADILEIKKSEKSSGLGVFQRQCDVEDDDRLLLRIPKCNILSVKNSCIANLLEDYVEEQIQKELVKYEGEDESDDEEKDEEEEEDGVDLSIELHSLVLCFIYEHSMGSKSPWFEYINSIDLEGGDLPLCLWGEEDKKLLQNTECDLLHMLDISELVELFAECIRFARSNSLYIDIPLVLNWEGDDFQNELVKSKNQLEKFGRFLQAVLSRSFPIDGYHGLSLVPGADMFNHNDLADVKFARDEDVCDQCGERDCDHDQDDSQDEGEDFEEDDFDEEEIEEILENDEDVDSEEGEDSIDVESASVNNITMNNEDVEDETMALDKELESSDDEFESETELVSSEDETATETEDVDEDEEQEEVVEEITAEYIKIMEKELEEEEMEDEESDSEGEDDNESLLELSEDENEDENADENADADELGKQLATDQCCDVFLLNSKKGEELYNFYGEFSNPILLQRYGFVEEDNISDSCMLTVQMFAYLKKIAGRRGTQLDIKLQWYDEMGFELVNDLLKIGLQSNGHDHEHDHDHDHDHDGEDCEENQCCDSESDDESEEEEEPISWELSPKVNLEGSPTPQTYALLRLILMPFNLFQAKFLHCQSESKLCRRILKLLLPNSMPILHPRVKREHEQVFKVFNLWCKNRLNRYSDGLSTGDYDKLLLDSSLSSQRRTILRLLKLEKEILARGCVFSAKDYDAQYSEE